MMNHAQKISADHKTAHRSKPVATSPPVGRIRKLDETTKGCRGNSQGQKAVRPPYDVANAFLGMQFYTRLQEPQIGENYNGSKLERDYFKSLSKISKKLQLTKLDCSDMPFPYNISTSLADLKEQLKSDRADWKDVRLVNDGNNTFFAREDRYDTSYTLFYIPIIPLYTILHKKQTAKASKLLISIYAYLYQVLGVPYYRDEDCYLNYMYETLENSCLEDLEEEEDEARNDESLIEFKDAILVGDFMKELIEDPKILRSFHRQVQNFRPKNDFEKEVLLIATSFYELFSEYPNVRIDRKFLHGRLREPNEGYESPIMLDNYVSFCASIKGNLFEILCDFVNSDLQEFTEIEEPTRFIPYDNRTIENNDFDFEDKVFTTIERLIQLWQEHHF